MNCTECNDSIYLINYTNFVNSNLLVGALLIITTITNTSLFCSIKKQLNNLQVNIQNNLIPPLYKDQV